MSRTQSSAENPFFDLNYRVQSGYLELAAIVRNLLMNIVLSTPLTSVRADAETSPAVNQSERTRTAERAVSAAISLGTAARAASAANTAPKPADGARPRRVSRPRNRSRPRERQLLTVPTERPIRRAASSQV